MQYLILILLVVSASANYNYGHFYLLPTYEDYYGGYYGHYYGIYGQDRDTYTTNVDAPATSYAAIFNRGEVANSPRALPYLDPRSNDLIPAPSFDFFDITRDTVRRPATWAAAPAVAYVGARPVSPAATPAKAAVPAFRYIPGHPYSTPVIYGYSSGAYTYYSPSVLSPYSYGSYGSYGSYHSEPYGYLYKK